MKSVRHIKGLTEGLNCFLQLTSEFRKNKIFIPKGVYKFKTLEEAEKWRHLMIIGKSPVHRR
ncbi:MAG: hypothetical protein ABIJ11_00780 [Elusimicrobiota bacterium]